MTSSDNILKAMSGRPHEVMTLEQVMNAMEIGQSYIAEPGYFQEIVRRARVGFSSETLARGRTISHCKNGKWSINCMTSVAVTDQCLTLAEALTLQKDTFDFSPEDDIAE